MPKSLQMMSVNQIAAQIKLTDMWKTLNDSQYPLRVEQKSVACAAICSEEVILSSFS